MSASKSTEPPSADDLIAAFERTATYTVGLEDEVMVLEADTLELAPRAREVLARLDGDGRFKLELPASQVEIITAPRDTVPEAAAELALARRELAARLNARLNRVRVEAVRGDLFGAVPARRFDLIVSNPPYLPSPKDELPRRGIARATEAGRSGRAFIDRICAGAASHLRDDGVLLLVHSSVCGEQRTLDALGATGLRVRVAGRRRGPLGPLLRARVDWLRREGLLSDRGDEELLVFRAQRRSIRHPSEDAASDAQRARIAAR